MKNYYYLLLLVVIGCGPSLSEEVADAYESLPKNIDYNIHVKPILSDRCFACHGNDKNKLKAGLRLDNAGGAYAVLAYMAQDVVVQFGWLSAGEMIDALGLAEINWRSVSVNLVDGSHHQPAAEFS